MIFFGNEEIFEEMSKNLASPFLKFWIR